MRLFDLSTILSAGTAQAHDDQDRRGIYLSNVVSFLLCGILIFLLAGRCLILRDYEKIFNTSLLAYLSGFLIFMCPLFFNRAGWTNFSRLFQCTVPSLYVWYQFVTQTYINQGLLVSQIDTLRIYLIALSGLPYLVLNVNQPRVFILGILPSLLSLLFFETLASWLMGEHYRGMVVEADYALMPMRTRVAFLIVSSFCMSFHWTIVQNDKKVNALIKQLQVKNEKINEQNRELKIRDESLSELNAHLEEMVEEKTQKIHLQNEQILKYAFANAHEFRGPVSRLLALVGVRKIDKTIDQEWLLDNIEITTKELDEIVKRISKELRNVG